MNAKILAILFITGCATTEQPGPRTHDPTSPSLPPGVQLLDDTTEHWLVKIPKSAGRDAIARTAETLKGLPEGSAETQTTPSIPSESTTLDPAALLVGRVEGRIEDNGTGIASCRVRLAPMTRNLGVLFWEESIGTQPTTVTGSTGEFVFENVPPGAYRLKWAVPGATHWIKRLREEPDLFVDGGRTTHLPTLNFEVYPR